MTKKVNKTGFTLIEVVLTIAIGALIFLLAFIAFRGAQVNRRDSQRRSDLDKIAAEVSNYASDNSGAVPAVSTFSTFLTNYAGSLKDPRSTGSYTAGTGSVASNTLADPTTAITDSQSATVVYTAIDGKAGSPTTLLPCDTGATAMTSKNSFVIKMKLEKGVACRDSASN